MQKGVVAGIEVVSLSFDGKFGNQVWCSGWAGFGPLRLVLGLSSTISGAGVSPLKLPDRFCAFWGCFGTISGLFSSRPGSPSFGPDLPDQFGLLLFS